MSAPRLLAASEAALREACTVLRAGGLVAVPTETVYGLAADASNPAAILRIFAAKSRPLGHPLIVHAASTAQAKAQCAFWPAAADVLAAAFWPGPLTLVLPRAPAVRDELTFGGATVAVRVPAHPLLLQLISVYGAPLAAPSANRHQELSPTCAEHVRAGLGAAVDLILDGGPCAAGIESSVVDLSPLLRDQAPRLLRPGPLSEAQLRAHLPSLAPYVANQVQQQMMHDAPGLARRHYAPKLPLLLLSREALQERLLREDDSVWIARNGTGLRGRGEALGDEPEGYAARLFAALHRLQCSGAARILVEQLPDEPRWAALRDRLWRAAAE